MSSGYGSPAIFVPGNGHPIQDFRIYPYAEFCLVGGHFQTIAAWQFLQTQKGPEGWHSNVISQRKTAAEAAVPGETPVVYQAVRLRRAMLARPSSPEPKSQTAGGTGIAVSVR